MKKALRTIVAILCVFTILFPAGIVMVAATGTDTVPEGYTPIYTANEFNNIRNNLSGKYILMNDIDLSSYYKWDPIGTGATPFTGELDGNGYSISNMTIYGDFGDSNKLYFGVFAYIKNSVIKNLAVYNTSVDINYTGSAKNSFYAGVIAGASTASTIENCISAGYVNLEGFFYGSAGGIAGRDNTGTIKRCISYTSINITSQNIYGIDIGGIAGVTSHDTVSECGNYGDISVNCINSDIDSRTLYVGGISGDNSNVSVVSDCFNRGNIDIDFCMPSIYVGGITGNSWSVMNSYNMGKISVPADFAGYIGGFSGDYQTLVIAVAPSNIIENLYYINEELTPTYIDGTFRDDYNYDSENVKLLTEDEFKKQESFVGFDFDDIWVMEEDGYPVLKNRPEIPQSVILSGECGDNVYYEFNRFTGHLRIYGNGKMDNYDTFTMFEWTSCAPWYYESEFVKNVVVEEGVTSIGACAFNNCYNLTSTEIPQSVKSIGYGAFSYCSKLENIDIPESTEEIGIGAFYECVSLKRISIPKGVTELDSETFYYCISLEEITVDSENPSYSSDEYGVLFNKGKTDLIRYPSGNKRTSYTVPESVEKINAAAFTGAKNLESIIFPDNLKSIGMEAFYNCSGLKEVNLPSGLENLSIFSFGWCTGLERLTVPEGIKSLGSHAFYHCESLATISLPDSLERIDSDTFEYTAFKENEQNWINGVLYCGKYLLAVKEDYTGKLEIKHGTRMIADFAMNRCKKITEVTMPDSLKIIGEGAFNICSELKSVKIPASVTTLTGSTFRFCDSLVSVTIPETVTSMGNQVFYECKNLESVVIKAKVSTIGNSMFFNCPKLTSVTLPDTITVIDEAAFRECDSLETIILPDSVEIIAEQAFGWSPKLTNINIPESLTTIGCNAFTSTNISKIHIPENVSTIDVSAFRNTANLSEFSVDENNESFMYDGYALYTKDKSRLLCYFISNEDKLYVIDENVKQIDDYAFENNIHLERITIPDGVTDMGISFGGCTNLKSIAVGNSVSTIYTYCFKNCTVLEKIYIPDSVTEMVYYSFQGSNNIKDVYYSGSQEEWNQIKNLSRITEFKNATIHYNHIHSHSLDELSSETYPAYGYRLYSCECGHYYAEYDIVSKSDKYDVSATYHPDCFDEDVTLDVDFVEGDREPGGVYVVDGKTYIQVGVYNLKAVNDNGDVVQPNEGYTVKIKMAIPDEYKGKTNMVIYHRFVDGGREKLSTSDGTLVLQDGYMIFEISKFSEFEVLVGTAELSVSKLPDKLKYRYRSSGIDLSGIQLKLTDIDGSVEYIDDTSKMTVEGFDSTKRGVQTVTVKYEDYTCTFEVETYYTWWQWIIRILFFIWY